MFSEQIAFALLSLLISALVVHLILRLGLHGILDEPNHRSLHEQPVPRSGGLGIVAAMVLGFYVARGPWPIAAGTLILGMVSYADDQWGLPVWVRLLMHLGVAAGLLLLGPYSGWSRMTLLFAILAIVWMTNLYNFMDGADGLAGGMAFFGFGAYAVAATGGGYGPLANLSACIAAGALGFLIFNFHPARIFMGDIGSISLGFLAAALGLEGIHRGAWEAWFPIVVFSPFIVDASVTLFRRVARRERVWQAHREHYYQRMVRFGMGHRNTALFWYAAMIGSGLTACGLLRADKVFLAPVLFIWVSLYGLCAYLVDARWHRYVQGGTSC